MRKREGGRLGIIRQCHSRHASVRASMRPSHCVAIRDWSCRWLRFLTIPAILLAAILARFSVFELGTHCWTPHRVLCVFNHAPSSSFLLIFAHQRCLSSFSTRFFSSSSSSSFFFTSFWYIVMIELYSSLICVHQQSWH